MKMGISDVIPMKMGISDVIPMKMGISDSRLRGNDSINTGMTV